ncbi:MAG TPA: flippase [Chloroflexota bacterium]|nr:flippase [Chloroflexota bacterium]
MIARRVAVNTLAPFAANLVGRGLALVTAVVMARTLGPTGTGAYAFAVNLWLYASIVSDFGLGTWLTREIARAPEQAAPLVRLSLGLRLALSGAGAIALVLVAVAYRSLGIGDVDLAIVATAGLLGAGLLPGAVSAAGTALFNAHERMVFPAAVQLLTGCLTASLGIVALLAGGGIIALGWVSLIVTCLGAVVFAVASARAFVPLGATVRPTAQLALAREALPLMLNALLNNVFFRVDIQVLQSRGSAVVGNYANAYKVIDAAGTVPSSFVLALFPQLARRAGSEGGLVRVYALAGKMLLTAAVCIAVPVTLLAEQITRLAWGPEFLPHSAVALRILIWFLPLSFFNGLTQYVLIALGLQAKITRAFAVAAAFNVAANLLLIPRYSYVAAAWVTIATEVVLLVPFVMALRDRVDLGRLARSLVSLDGEEVALLRSALKRGGR